jgi:hypothetical protein
MIKMNHKHGQIIKNLFFMGFLSCAVGSYAQRPAVGADLQLGTIRLLDDAGTAIDASSLETDKVIRMLIPVMNDNHGKTIPAGSCKIKIGLGSKMEIDPLFNMNTVALGSYFTWTSAVNGGQVQITGELVNELPADVTYVNVAFKVKPTVEGNSTITSNFLITNHNSSAVLSDENGSNNVASLAYKVNKVTPLPTGEATQPFLYPNPVVDVKSVMIETRQGVFTGNYTINISDAAGKSIQTGLVELNGVKRFSYKIGDIAAGKYIMQLRKPGTAQVYNLKFEKL